MTTSAWPPASTSATRGISVRPSGTASEKALINSLTAPVLGLSVDEMPDLATLLFAPAMAGTEVSVE